MAVYSNNFGVSATLTDFTIYFLEVGQIPGEKGVAAHKQEMKAIVRFLFLRRPDFNKSCSKFKNEPPNW